MKNLFIFFSLILLFSCDKKQENNKEEQDDSKPMLSVVKKHAAIKKIDTAFNKEIKDWEEFQTVNNFLARFKKVSPNEILSNASELNDLVKSLIESVKPQLFNTDSFNARLNILYTETLRLVDMNSIPAITADEVNLQMEKIIEAFSAVNSKINSVLAKKRFEDAIDVDVKFIGLDSTKIDSISKKSIKRELLERQIKKKN
ncbi:hypothetical protein K8354_15920 [Polaribacter litorisediminis]|uniref:hypothetical protein n=1 Tax=Polaribacter litorisediminis TaxID=1908341 RepID=UPI001CBEDCC1|nr:hypothetical protein [Polaribacter litorisediminis]UAM97763.1 hypothetical protein K8354_15920 [Polaribacter litorisediminis]